MEVKLQDYKKQKHQQKKSIVLFLWILISGIIFQSSIPFPILLKKILLKLFGAKIGDGFVIKSKVNIKYPWKLIIGNHVWIGEGVWIDNLDFVNIHSNVCISQGAMLLTGNHDYRSSSFDLMMGPILLKEGVWIAAKSVVCPNVTCEKNSILTVGSILQKNTKENGIYKGNPAIYLRNRVNES